MSANYNTQTNTPFGPSCVHNSITIMPQTKPYSNITVSPLFSPFFLSTSLFVRKYGWMTGQPSGVTHSTGFCRTRAMTSAHVTSQSWPHHHQHCINNTNSMAQPTAQTTVQDLLFVFISSTVDTRSQSYQNAKFY